MSDDARGSEGKLLGGRYRLGAVIGEGAMGAVYEATDTRTPGSRFAVKLLHARFRGDLEIAARARREAEVVEQIRSPYVARVFNAGVNREGRAWIVFEYLSGESLEARLRREPRPPFADVSRIVEQMLLGLEAAHLVSVVHRDIKPANLFIEKKTRVLRILDFGVAKRLRGGKATSALTSVGDIIGTPSYMSPEQLADSKEIDARADIYSAGLVAYRLIAGRLPFEHHDLGAMLSMKRAGAIPSLAQVTGVTWPDVLDGWIQRASAVRRDERFESARAALTAWERASEVTMNHDAKPAATGTRLEDTDVIPPSSE